jgi:uncharacterized protein (TIGR02246 family)
MSVLALAGFCAQLASAQDVGGGDEAAIRAVGEAYVAAFNKGDAVALADYWSPDAVYVNRITGEQVVGREAIADQFKALFAGEGQETLAVSIDSIRFVSPNVAVEQGIASFGGTESDADATEYTAVYVRRDGKWLLDRVTDEPSSTSSSNYQHLRELEWLIGSWVDQDETVRIVTECNWTKNQNFITRSFTVSTGGEVELSGMQIIGWDAATKQVRSWTFDSDGGHAQGHWTKTGDTWHIRKKGSTGGGETTTAVNHIKLIDGDTFALQSTQRTVGGQLLPNIDQVLVLRQ